MTINQLKLKLLESYTGGDVEQTNLLNRIIFNATKVNYSVPPSEKVVTSTMVVMKLSAIANENWTEVERLKILLHEL